MERGKYIIFAGGEGAGKSEHAKRLTRYLEDKTHKVLYTREPGGTDFGEAVGEVFRNYYRDLDALTEAFIFEGLRNQLFKEVIIPTLEEGTHIISDRSFYDTLVYQGYVGGVDQRFIGEMNARATEGITPDLAILIDIDPREGLKKEKEKNRFSSKGLEYHKRVNRTFKNVAEWNPQGFVIVPYVEEGIMEMQQEIRKHVEEKLEL